MFTGLIEDLGKVDTWEAEGRSGRLVFETGLPLKEISLGSSIAVNGCCLTVVRKGRKRLAVDVSPETLERTNFAQIEPGDLVNLERSLRFADRLGGHLVTGHVDGIGVIEKIRRRGDFTFFEIRVPAVVGRLLVSKGSVAVDGISLTVNSCTTRSFSVVIIPFTLSHTNLQSHRVGGRVNLEADIVGKYVWQYMKVGRRRGRQGLP